MTAGANASACAHLEGGAPIDALASFGVFLVVLFAVVLLMPIVALIGFLVVRARREKKRYRACACGRESLSVADDAPWVVLIHGTFARHAPWVREGSQFRQAVERERGGPVNFSVFCWSGANSQLARVRASEDLASMIDQHSPERGEPFVVGHSHGGNVALLAAARAHTSVAGIVTLSTPFVHFSTRHSAPSRIAIAAVVVGIPLLSGIDQLTNLYAQPFWNPIVGACLIAAAVAGAGALVWAVVSAVRRRSIRVLLRRAVTTCALFGALFLLPSLLISEETNYLPSWALGWTIVALVTIALPSLISFAYLVGKKRGVIRFLRSRPEDLSNELNPDPQLDPPIMVLTGLSDEAAGGLTSAQFFGVIARALDRFFYQLLRLVLAFAGVVAGFSVWRELLRAADNSFLVAAESPVDWLHWFFMTNFFSFWLIPGMADNLPGILVAVAILGLFSSVAVNLFLLACGWDVPVIASKTVPLVQQAPLGRAEISVADLSGIGKGLHHGRIYAGEQGVGTWIAERCRV